MRFSLKKSISASLKNTKNKNFGMLRANLNLNQLKGTNKNMINLKETIIIINKKSTTRTIVLIMDNTRNMIIEMPTIRAKKNKNRIHHNKLKEINVI